MSLCSNSTSKWQAFPYTSCYGYIPMRVLYAVQFVQRASSSLHDQSILLAFTVFERICLIYLLDTSTFPLVCRWYGVDTLWRTPYFSNKHLKNLLQKWDPPITNIGPRCAKSREDVLFKKCCVTHPFIFWKFYGFHPFLHIIHCHKNIVHPMRTHKHPIN